MPRLLLFIIFNLTTTFYFAQSKSSSLTSPALCFTENRGQVHDQNYNFRSDVLYSAKVNNLLIHLRKDGVSYQSYQNKYVQRANSEIENEIIFYRIDVNWINPNEDFRIETKIELSSYSNYYLASCPDGITQVRRGLLD